MEKSSINVTNYNTPFIDASEIIPLTYECIRSNIPLDLLSLLGKVSLKFFPSAHPLHTPYTIDDL